MAKAKKTAGKSARAKEAVAEIGVIGGSGLYSMSGLTEHARDSRENTVWRTVGRSCCRYS